MSNKARKIRNNKLLAEPRRKKASLKKNTWVCKRNDNNSHVFREYLPRDESVKSWLTNTLLSRCPNEVLEMPNIIQAYHNQERKEMVKSHSKGWAISFWKSQGITHHWKCVLCGKLAIDYELKPEKRIRSHLYNKI